MPNVFDFIHRAKGDFSQIEVAHSFKRRIV